MTDHYAMADMARRHERHTCSNHPPPGICVHDRERWPCDTRRLLGDLAASKYFGTLTCEARTVTAEWGRYVGTVDEDGHEDAWKVGDVVARLVAVLDAIDGLRANPLAPRTTAGDRSDR